MFFSLNPIDSTFVRNLYSSVLKCGLLWEMSRLQNIFILSDYSLFLRTL